MSEDKLQKLARMANQITDNFRAAPESEAIMAVSDHLRAYWTPKMIDDLAAHCRSGGEQLNAVAARALAALRDRA